MHSFMIWHHIKELMEQWLQSFGKLAAYKRFVFSKRSLNWIPGRSLYPKRVDMFYEDYRGGVEQGHLNLGQVDPQFWKNATKVTTLKTFRKRRRIRTTGMYFSSLNMEINEKKWRALLWAITRCNKHKTIVSQDNNNQYMVNHCNSI